jgi:hypothetical protein
LSSNLARKEPLDTDEEKMRRAIVSKYHEAQDRISTVESRLTLNNALFSCSADNQQGTVRASDYFNQLSKAQSMSHQETEGKATTTLFNSLTSGYDRVRNFDLEVKRISEKATRLRDSYESKLQGESHSGATRAKNKSISPRPTSHLTSPLISRRNSSNEPSILQRLQSLRQMTNELSNESGGCSSKHFSLRGQMMTQDSSTNENIPDWRSKGKNELFSSSKAALIPKPLAVSPVVKTLFSSHIMVDTKVRPDWNTTSELETTLL